jgi:aspartate 1-decarboxylase
MRVTLLKAKIHRATVTGADLTYEGSITIDRQLCAAAGILPYEKVDIYNCNTGGRLSTYVILGEAGEVCLNGAAARMVQRGDIVIIAAYAELELDEIAEHRPVVVQVDGANHVRSVHHEPIAGVPRA